MRVDEKTLRRHLQREAARVPMPDDMWKHISGELDKDAEAALKRRQMVKRFEPWKPALAFAAAAGIFWMAIIPTESPVRPNTITKPVQTEANEVQPGQNDNLQEVSRFVRFEKPTQESAGARKYSFARNSVSVQ